MPLTHLLEHSQTFDFIQSRPILTCSPHNHPSPSVFRVADVSRARRRYLIQIHSLLRTQSSSPRPSFAVPFTSQSTPVQRPASAPALIGKSPVPVPPVLSRGSLALQRARDSKSYRSSRCPRLRPRPSSIGTASIPSCMLSRSIADSSDDGRRKAGEVDVPPFSQCLGRPVRVSLSSSLPLRGLPGTEPRSGNGQE